MNKSMDKMQRMHKLHKYPGTRISTMVHKTQIKVHKNKNSQINE